MRRTTSRRLRKPVAVLAATVAAAALCAGCGTGRGHESPSAARGSSSPARPTSTARFVPPVATGDYADAVRAAHRHGLRVWLESDLVKRWLQGTASFQAALTQLGSLAALPGVVGIKIADELGYHDGLNSADRVHAFLAAASAGLARTAPGKPLLVDMIVPELGCDSTRQPPAVWGTICVVKLRGQYPQLTLDAITSYLRSGTIDVLDLSTGLLPDSTYVGWGTDRDAVQQDAWAEVVRLGWPKLVRMQARKALAHPGSYDKPADAAAADVHTWIDLPLAGGATAVDVWTWRQFYEGSINRILDPGLRSNVLWDELVQRHDRGARLFTHLSPHSLEVGLDTDLAKLAQVFSDVFVAAGTG